MAYSQQEFNIHGARTEGPVTSQDDVLSFHKKEEEELLFW